MFNNVNLITFNSSWNHYGKPISEFIGIELQVNFSSYCGDDEVDIEKTIFSLKDDEFTPENLHKYIQQNMFEIVEEKYHSGEVYFRLLYKDNKYNTTCSTSGIDTKEICSLFGPQYFNSLLQKV